MSLSGQGERGWGPFKPENSRGIKEILFLSRGYLGWLLALNMQESLSPLPEMESMWG